jgi:peptidoglycan/LPS O-acetylase OafA/YrhL
VKTGRVTSLEVLRACCALAVLISHVWGEGVDLPQIGPLTALSHYSVEAVVGFFVLSGCVISLQDYPSPGVYWRARMVRLMPIYYVVFALSLALMLGPGVPFTGLQAIGNLLFVQSLDWEKLWPLRFFIPSWSLSFELYYYTAFLAILLAPRLLLPLLAASIAVGLALSLLPPPPAPALWLLRAFAFFALWLAGVLVTWLVRRGHAVSLGTGVFMFAVGLCLARLPWSHPVKFDCARLFGVGLGFGFLVWALLSASPIGAAVPRRSWLDLGLPLRVELAALLLAVLWGVSESFRSTKLELSLVLAAAALVPASLAAVAQRVLRPATPAMLYVAGLSYALYLVHYPLLQAFNLWRPMPPLIDFAAVLVLSFALAHALDYMFQPWVRARLGRRRLALAGVEATKT